MRLTLDGRSWSVDLHRSSSLSRQIVFSYAWSTPGTHTITLQNLGTAGHARIDLDGMTILD